VLLRYTQPALTAHASVSTLINQERSTQQCNSIHSVSTLCLSAFPNNQATRDEINLNVFFPPKTMQRRKLVSGSGCSTRPRRCRGFRRPLCSTRCANQTLPCNVAISLRLPVHPAHCHSLCLCLSVSVSLFLSVSVSVSVSALSLSLSLSSSSSRLAQKCGGWQV
jgi:hypothetical protein